jgi:HK97 family phage prohead protease
MTVRHTRYHLTEAAPQIRAESDLPLGIAGRVSGVALTYEVVDSYQTMFARKSAKRTIDNKVAARKVPLLMDHERTSKAHVGVVTEMQDVGDALVMTADIFDTADGRAALEYVKAVLASGASTGFSIGFIPRASEMVTVDGKPVERFTEIELREVSITPMPAVPGAEVASARNDDVITDVMEEESPERTDDDLLLIAARVALDALPAEMRTALLETYTPTPTPTETASSATAIVADTPTSTEGTRYVAKAVTMEDRVKAARSTFVLPK